MKKLFLIFLAAVLLLSACGTNEKGIDLYATYNTNDLLIRDDFSVYYNGTEVFIPRLAGLTNSSVEKKINDDIYRSVMALINEHPTFTYTNHYTYANFANVISISFTVGFESEPYYENIYFNYNLNNGEVLQLEDLFMKDTDLLSIVRNAFYRSLSLYGEYDSDTNLHSPSEEEVYKCVKIYMDSPEKKFAFSPSEIFLYSDNVMASIKMLDYADLITIYSKFSTKKSIFTGEYQGYKNIFTCANAQYDLFDTIEYGFLEPNFFYDFTVWKGYYSEDTADDIITAVTAFSDKIYSNVYSEIEKHRLTAQENPDKFYILFLKPSVHIYSDAEYSNGKWTYCHSSVVSVNESLQLFEMPIEVYESTYKDKIIDTYRYEYFAMRGGAYLEPPENDGAIMTDVVDENLYNYKTGELVTNITDIFYEDSNYMPVIEEKVISRLISMYGYSESFAASLLNPMKCEIKGAKVQVTLEQLPQASINIYFSEFDNSMLKIFE